MNTILWLDLCQLLISVFLLTVFYWKTRHTPAIGSQGLLVTAGALSGFVIHAFMCFSGVGLILQLATITGIFCISWLAPRKPKVELEGVKENRDRIIS